MRDPSKNEADGEGELSLFAGAPGLQNRRIEQCCVADVVDKQRCDKRGAEPGWGRKWDTPVVLYSAVIGKHCEQHRNDARMPDGVYLSKVQASSNEHTR